MSERSLSSVLVLSATLLSGCDRAMLGLPRVPLSAASPDGRSIAFVRNHPTIDGPSQSVWLGPAGGSQIQLRRLGEDQDWCDTIVWSRDSSTVAFLVQDARLITADRASGNIVSDRWLTDWSGEYPPHRLVSGLSLSDDGREAIFRDCPRMGAAKARNRSCAERRTIIR